MARPRVKPQEFVGKTAYLAQRDAPPAAVLCTLTIDDPTSPGSVQARYPLGGEPVLGPDGERADRCPRSHLIRDVRRLGSVGRPPSAAQPTCQPIKPLRGTSSRWNISASATRSPSWWLARRRCSTRRTSGSGAERAGMEICVCVKRVPMVGGAIAVTPDALDVDTTMTGLHGQPPRGMRRRGSRAPHRASRRLGDRADARAARAAVDQLRDMLALGATRRSCSRPTAPTGARWRPLPRSPRRSPAVASTCCCSATRPPIPAATRCPCESRTRSDGRA